MTLRKSVFISLVYVLVVTLVTYSATLPHIINYRSVKEIIFGYWGYGWDGMHYIKIATQGYIFPLQAFFPLYPLTIKLNSYLLPLSIAQRLNILLFPCLLLVLSKVASKTDAQSGSVVALLSFPTAFFLQANYTESLFIILTGLSLILVVNKQYLPTAVLSALAGATKITGVALGAVLILSYLSSNRHWIAHPTVWIKAFLLMILANLGIILYFIYLSASFGSLNIFFKAQSQWSRSMTVSTTSMMEYLKPTITSIKSGDISTYRRLSEVTCVMLAFVLLVLSRKKLPWEFWLYSLAAVLIPILTGSLLSFNRLILCAFPLLIFLYSYLSKNTSLYWIAVGAGTIIQIVGINLFLHGVFVG